MVDLLATIGVGIAIKGEGLRLSNGFLADAVLLRREENLADMKGSSSQGDRQFIVFHKTIALPAGSLRRFGTSDEKIYDWYSRTRPTKSLQSNAESHRPESSNSRDKPNHSPEMQSKCRVIV